MEVGWWKEHEVICILIGSVICINQKVAYLAEKPLVAQFIDMKIPRNISANRKAFIGEIYTYVQEELAICEDIDQIELQGLKDILWLLWVVRIGGNIFLI
ncbi:hypothetical protein YC2023_002665 [Brassica napus]